MGEMIYQTWFDIKGEKGTAKSAWVDEQMSTYRSTIREPQAIYILNDYGYDDDEQGISINMMTAPHLASPQMDGSVDTRPLFERSTESDQKGEPDGSGKDKQLLANGSTDIEGETEADTPIILTITQTGLAVEESLKTSWFRRANPQLEKEIDNKTRVQFQESIGLY
jgi:hypothetical protein